MCVPASPAFRHPRNDTSYSCEVGKQHNQNIGNSLVTSRKSHLFESCVGMHLVVMCPWGNMIHKYHHSIYSHICNSTWHHRCMHNSFVLLQPECLASKQLSAGLPHSSNTILQQFSWFTFTVGSLQLIYTENVRFFGKSQCIYCMNLWLVHK